MWGKIRQTGTEFIASSTGCGRSCLSCTIEVHLAFTSQVLENCSTHLARDVATWRPNLVFPTEITRDCANKHYRPAEQAALWPGVRLVVFDPCVMVAGSQVDCSHVRHSLEPWRICVSRDRKTSTIRWWISQGS